MIPPGQKREGVKNEQPVCLQVICDLSRCPIYKGHMMNQSRSSLHPLVWHWDQR